MSEAETTAQRALRGYILASGRDDWVPIASLLSRISRDGLTDSAAEHQRLIVETVRSLLADRLIEIGDIPGQGDSEFSPWPGTPDEVMAQFTHRFVEHHDDRLGWEYTIWLNLTSAGEQASVIL